MSKWQKTILWAMGIFYAIGGVYLAYAAIVMAGEELLGRAILFALGSGAMVFFSTLCGLTIRSTRRLERMGCTDIGIICSLQEALEEVTLPRRRRTREWTTAQKEAAFFAALWLASLVLVTIYGLRDGDSVVHLALVWAVSIAVYSVLALLYLLPEIVRRKERGY